MLILALGESLRPPLLTPLEDSSAGMLALMPSGTEGGREGGKEGTKEESEGTSVQCIFSDGES